MLQNQNSNTTRYAALALVFLASASPSFGEDKRYVPFWMKNKNAQQSTAATWNKPSTSKPSKAASQARAGQHSWNTSKTVPPPKKSLSLVQEPYDQLWMDISAADKISYKIPLYHGHRTKVMRTTEGEVQTASMYGSQVILQTRDPAYDVYLWYRNALPQAGFALNEKYPAKSLFGQAYMVRGDSHTDQAMISINPQDDEKGPCTHIQVSIAPKHNVGP